MVKIISTTRDDIETGFDILIDENVYDTGKKKIKEKLVEGGYGADFIPEDQYEPIAKETIAVLKREVPALLEKAEEIFFEEASLSKWSGNMIDNSAVAVAEPDLKINGYHVKLNTRVGISKKGISTGNGTWTTQPVKVRRRNSRGVLYYYHGYRMHYGVDYSKYLDDGTATRSPNISAWVGFVKRAEDRFDAI